MALCAWVIGAALAIQLIIWGLTTFTQVRYTEIKTAADAPAVVVHRDAGKQRLNLFDADVEAAPGDEAVDPNRVLSRFDNVFSTMSALARGFGVIGCLALLPLLGLGVLLAASSATAGVERAVSALGWALAAVFLSMPFGALIGLPWDDGALWEYSALCAAVDGVGGAPGVLDGATSGKLTFFAQFLLLPIVCIASLLLTATMFSSGVEAGLMRREALGLDETLELEAGNVKPSSLHGGRAAAALAHSASVSQSSGSHATVKQLSPGSEPKRLI
ncbi:MAG: hypothetical protein ACYTGP_06110 [Planctomycetota bacterium]